MKVLALDTATEACSVALYVDGEVTCRYELAPRRHSQLVLTQAQALLEQAGLEPAQLDALAFGRGPGAFTGVRIAASTVQGIALALDLPVVGVSTLAALAQGCFRRQGARSVLAAIDARMQEVYWGAFSVNGAGLMQPLVDECVGLPARVPVPDGGPWVGAGSGWDRYEAELAECVGDRLEAVHRERYPSAEDVVVLGVAALEAGQGVPAEKALPVYLRDQVVHQH